MTSISASNFNKSIVIQRRSLSSDDFGGIVQEWIDLYQTWAQIVQIHNTPYQVRSKNFTHNFYKIYIRKRPGISRLIRIKHEGAIYNVEKIQHLDNGSQLIEIIAYQKVKNVVPCKR